MESRLAQPWHWKGEAEPATFRCHCDTGLLKPIRPARAHGRASPGRGTIGGWHSVLRRALRRSSSARCSRTSVILVQLQEQFAATSFAGRARTHRTGTPTFAVPPLWTGHSCLCSLAPRCLTAYSRPDGCFYSCIAWDCARELGLNMVQCRTALGLAVILVLLAIEPPANGNPLTELIELTAKLAGRAVQRATSHLMRLRLRLLPIVHSATRCSKKLNRLVDVRWQKN
jgi:hypothetical protein